MEIIILLLIICKIFEGTGAAMGDKHQHYDR